MELTASELWSRILQAVQAGLPEQAFRTWLAGTRPGALTERELQVEVPSQFHVEWLGERYGALLEGAAARVLGRPLSITFTPGASSPDIPTVELSRSPHPGNPRKGPTPTEAPVRA